MININILTYLDYNLFDQQLDLNSFSNFCFFENSDLDIEWDMLVVFEDLKFPKKIKCRKGGLVFIAAEPSMSSVYSNIFLKQFDTLFIAHPNHKNKNNLIHKQFYNDWHFGFDFKSKSYKYTFDEIQNLSIPNKTKNISVITSSQAKLPLHLKRLDFIQKIKKVFGDEIDYYGHGFNPIDDKADALLPYRFHICIENECTYDLWTEKFSDPLIAFSVPIYIGCINMENYFPKDSFFQLDINNIDESVALLSEILSNPSKHYNDKLEQLLYSRSLLIEKYNIYPTLVDLFCTKKLSLGDVLISEINPNQSYYQHTLLNYKLRLKRFLFKRFFIFKNFFKW